VVDEAAGGRAGAPLYLRGWAVRTDGAPVDRLTVHADGAIVAEISVDLDRPDVVRALHLDVAARPGWMSVIDLRTTGGDDGLPVCIELGVGDERHRLMLEAHAR
jgi:hypothetical protein